jgi:ribonuclease Z
MLALTHVSTRHPLGLLRDEARAVFPNTVVPRDFDTIEIPLAERGEPTLVRWDASAHPAEQTPARA